MWTIASKFFQKNLFFIYLLIYLIKSFLLPNIKILSFQLFYRLKSLSISRISEYKKSETIFIMGGGETINEITPQQWQTIKTNDSLGINRWLMHKHVPTYMLIEGYKKSEVKDDSAINDWYDLWRSSDSRTINTLFIIKDLDSLKIRFSELMNFKDRLSPMYKLVVPGTSIKSVSKSFKILSKYQIFNNIKYPVGSKGSITHAVSFALLAGYKNIVLCGIDLGGNYFWENGNTNDLFWKQKDLITQKDTQLLDKKHHITNKRSHDEEVVIEDLLVLIEKHIKRSSDQKIFVSSKNSGLSKHFKIYFNEE